MVYFYRNFEIQTISTDKFVFWGSHTYKADIVQHFHKIPKHTPIFKLRLLLILLFFQVTKDIHLFHNGINILGNVNESCPTGGIFLR